MIGKNNPFNVRSNKHNKWQGQIGTKKGFACFATPELGIRAAIIVVMRSYRNFGIVTIQDIIKRFAPEIENNTQQYIVKVVSNTQIAPLKPLNSQDQYARVLHAMSIVEGNEVPYSKILDVMKLFNIQMSVNYEKENS